jgi:phenylpyruvate tautomerase PptA (4-oxalocrotonate tautomerase family)
MALARELTSAVQRVLGSQPDRIHVILSEHAAGEWIVGGQPLSVPDEAVQ